MYREAFPDVSFQLEDQVADLGMMQNIGAIPEPQAAEA